jgi:hypothetical protein
MKESLTADRRSFLKRTAGSVVGLTTLASTASADESIPQVSTRGHFDVDWKWEMSRNEAYTPREYETNGTIPGYHTEERPDELIVFVHGWVKLGEVAPRFERQRAELRAAGVDSPIINYTWDSDRGKEYIPIADNPWWPAGAVADRNGPKLASFIEDYARRSPETTIRVIGSSLGGRLVPAGIAALEERTSNVVVDTVTLFGAAVPLEDVAADGTYGPGLAENAASVHNYHKTNDKLLTVGRVLEPDPDRMVGKYGLPADRQPAGYTDHKVNYVRSHGDYWKVEHGCVDAAVEAWD